MLRRLIAVLLAANLIVFALLSGAFNPLLAAGDLQPAHLSMQVHPDWLTVQGE